MVQLSPSSPSTHGESHLVNNEDYKYLDSKGSLKLLQTSISPTASPLQVFETYLDNGLVSLKHKIRNIEKRKVKLEDYKERRNNGEVLNQDQLEAVAKYEEVIHNLEFAKDLQKTFSVLNQDLLKAQKKALRRENLLKVEMEKKRLRTILQIQYMFQSYSQEHVQKDFKDGLHGALCLSSKELDYLSKFSRLVCSTRHQHMSLEDQMDQLSAYFWNLLDGSEKTVAGTNYKYLKDLLSRLLDCGYFESVPDPPCEQKIPEPSLHALTKNHTSEVKHDHSRGVNTKPSCDTKPLVDYVRCELPVSNTTPVLLVKEAPEPKPVQNAHTKLQGLRPWGTSADLKLQEPKRWPSPQPLTPLRKSWEAASLVQNCPPVKKCETEPKEKRERVRKVPPEIKITASSKPELPVPLVINGQSPLKRRELPSAFQENCNLPASLSTTQCHGVTPQSPTEFCSSPNLPKDPELRKKKLEDLIDQIKGTYNFMQDSVLEFEYPSRRASPLPLQSTPKVAHDLHQTSRADLPSPKKVSPAQTPPAPIQLETSEPLKQTFSEPETTETTEPTLQSPNRPVTPVPEDDFVPEENLVLNSNPEVPERSQTPLPSDQIASPKTPDNTTVLPLQQDRVSISPRSTPVRLNALHSPFPGMQAVFKVHAPIPPCKELEVTAEPYSPEFHQTFSTVSTQTLPQCPLDNAGEQNIFIQEPLCGSPYTTSGIHQMNSVSCYTTAANLLPRMTQPFVNSRGSARGTSRGRIMTNGLRCPTPYKGPEGYRGAHSVNNGNYGHAPCAGRDYNSAQFVPRDGNGHLGNKRGTITTGVRSNSRGWSESSQTSSPERNDVFSTDSGHGDSRSLSTSDMSMCSQATTLLPVHVYPLPQQMRVAFSAARTSNFAPGTLDQPIVFDLLLNNLGDTFDFQLGRFQCPVNGTYVFIFHMLKLAVNVPLYVNLMKNEEVLVSAYANDGAPDHETASNHAVMQLFQGDQIWLRLHRGAIYGSSWKYSTFSGYLLYQD
ncbi:caprin-2 isoform X1 [Pelobates fuscus]|uniref:caprin-2 isoform X1 n=1 Tax=Pelobates fuscus TaxID=191477 RepID=UPI002FE48705